MSVKKKIWWVEYVDLFNLLHMKPDPTPKIGDPVKDQEKKQKTEKNLINWLHKYSIYMAVLLQMHNIRALSLIKYQNLRAQF